MISPFSKGRRKLIAFITDPQVIRAIAATVDTGIRTVVAISTDKASNSAKRYEATKLVAEMIFIAANAYADGKVILPVVRYGNVVGLRGSVVPFIMGLKKKGTKESPISDELMARFWITLDQGVDLVLKALDICQGGEIFITKMPSMKVTALAKILDADPR